MTTLYSIEKVNCCSTAQKLGTKKWKRTSVISLARKVDFMFEVVMGDILCATTGYICHQVNCRNVMGSGVAKSIYTKYPEVKSEYHRFCSLAKSPYDLLGQAQIVPILVSLTMVAKVASYTLTTRR